MRGRVINDLVEFPASFLEQKLPSAIPQRSEDLTGPNLGKIGQPSAHKKVYFGTDMLLRFERRAAQKQVQ